MNFEFTDKNMGLLRVTTLKKSPKLGFQTIWLDKKFVDTGMILDLDNVYTIHLIMEKYNNGREWITVVNHVRLNKNSLRIHYHMEPYDMMWMHEEMQYVTYGRTRDRVDNAKPLCKSIMKSLKKSESKYAKPQFSKAWKLQEYVRRLTFIQAKYTLNPFSPPHPPALFSEEIRVNLDTINKFPFSFPIICSVEQYDLDMLSQHLVIMKQDFISAEQEEAIIAQYVEKPNEIDDDGDSEMS